MKIEVGKSYKLRNGDVVTISEYDAGRGGAWPFISKNADDDGLYGNSWTEEGYLVDFKSTDNRDIVSVAEDKHQFSPEFIAEAIARNPEPLVINTIRCLLPEDSYARKDIPVTTGVLDYFPLAIAAVAQLSKAGNDKHNPGEPLHWARGKSTDHADCIGRHLIDRGRFAEDGTRHSAALAWRALALLQEELEAEAGTGPVSR